VNAAFGILDILVLSEVVVAVGSEPKVGTTLSTVEVTVNSSSPADVDTSSVVSEKIGSDMEGVVEVPVCAATGQGAVLATLVVASGM
jgi:hypothetical protein